MFQYELRWVVTDYIRPPGSSGLSHCFMSLNSQADTVSKCTSAFILGVMQAACCMQGVDDRNTGFECYHCYTFRMQIHRIRSQYDRNAGCRQPALRSHAGCIRSYAYGRTVVCSLLTIVSRLHTIVIRSNTACMHAAFDRNTPAHDRITAVCRLLTIVFRWKYNGNGINDVV